MVKHFARAKSILSSFLRVGSSEEDSGLSEECSVRGSLERIGDHSSDQCQFQNELDFFNDDLGQSFSNKTYIIRSPGFVHYPMN